MKKVKNEDCKFVFVMPEEFGDGVSSVVWDPLEGPLYMCSPDDVGLEPGDTLTIKVAEMTAKQIEDLPEM